MTVTADIAKQLLPRPPRPLPDGSGYDWREFDRWMQKIYSLIGASANDKAYNVPGLLQQLGDERMSLDFVTDQGMKNPVVDIAPDFITDNILEIQLLRQLVEQLITEVSMLSQQDNNRQTAIPPDISSDMATSQQQDIANIHRKINDIYVELGVS